MGRQMKGRSKLLDPSLTKGLAMLTLPEPILPVLILFATLFRGPTWRKAQVLLVSAILAPGQRIDHLAHIDPQALAKLQGVKVLWVNGENGGPHKWAVGTTFEWEFDFPVTTNPAYEASRHLNPNPPMGRRGRQGKLG